jgi:hypothetical protein
MGGGDGILVVGWLPAEILLDREQPGLLPDKFRVEVLRSCDSLAALHSMAAGRPIDRPTSVSKVIDATLKRPFTPPQCGP